MLFFWYDHRRKYESGKEKPGPEAFGDGKLIALFNASYISAAVDFSEKLTPSLAFVHAGIEEGNLMSDWLKVVEVSKTRYVMFVSSEKIPEPRISDSNAKGIYCLNPPLSSVTKFLSDNPNKVQYFIKSCESGTPDWTVFEPVVYPENLVAWYLVQIAKQHIDINSEDLSSGLESEAEKEYRELKNTHDHDGAFDRDGIKALFEKMASLL